MKNQMKLLTCLTKPFVLFVLLFALGVGQMWGEGTKRIYCEYSNVSSWWGTVYVYAWGGGKDAKKYTMVATGTTNLVRCDIDDYHTDLLFYKSSTQGGSWETQSVDVSISSNNRWSLGDGGYGNKATISNQQRYAPGTAIDGLVDIKNPHNQMFTNGEYSVTLAAHQTYEFKILETSTLYGLNDLIATSSISNQTLNTSGYQVRLCTAGAGTYTFAYNTTNHQLSITYPTTDHPSIDYCYVIDYSWSPSANLHVWNGTSTKVAEWNGSSTIEGSIWPGAAVSNKTTIGGQSYFYIAPGEFDYFMLSKNGDNNDRSGEIQPSDGYGKRRYWKDASDGWIWDTFTVRIQLENEDATSTGTEYQDIAFNSGVLSDITCPTKTHYDFQGYYTGDGGTGTQVIDKDGHWIASVADYTDASKHWVHAGASTTLYAKWTEHEYAVTLAISPDGTGTTSPSSSTTAKYVTASGDITATPSTGYSFREWGFSETGTGNYDVYVSDDKTYSSTSNPIKIKAQRDGTLTANFTANGYTVTLENNDADEGHKGTENVSVTYNATTGLTDAITKPEKSHYDFGGYYTSDDEGATLGTQLIDENGNWKKGISGYTGTSGDDATWVYAGNITLYAKWTETAYTITPSVNPAGAGSVNTVTDAHLVTPSSEITATPANAAWIFDYWECGDQVGIASGSGTNAVTVTAGKNSTITAHFKPRFSLVGSLYEGDEGGMPGWEDYTKTFAVNSTSPMDLSRTCTLQANSTYKVQVHDNATSTNLGRSGCNPVCVLEENASLLMENSNNDVFLYTSGAGEYIFKITAIDGSDHPTLTVLRPYPVNFGQKYEDIDGTLHIGTTGGTAAATAGGDALTSGDYVTYNTSVTHTATPASGYTFAGWWSSDAFEGDAFSNTNPMTYAVTSGDNIYAKFVETSTSVTLSNDGHGNVQIGGADATSTTCGVTTTRSLTAVPNAGYKFKNWTTSSSPDFEVDDYDAAEVTLTGHGAGTAGTLTANFEERYSIKGTMNGENWGTTHTLTNIGTNAGSKDTCYVTMTLPANTTYEFAIYDEQTGGWLKNSTSEVFKMTYTNHTNWEFGTDKNVNCGITTAGKGTYKFIFNITDKTVTVVYPTSYQVNYGASVGGSVTSVLDGDGNAVPNGGYVVAGGSVTYTATPNDGYTFVGWCHDDSYGDTFTNINPWTNSDVAATSSAYAKFKSTNFVIYRTGDMEDDPRAALDDVESYGGGIISEIIEFRMKVRELDKWYSLCLPFDVNAVKVWEDGTYYDLVPFYRPEVGGIFYTGDYIIRTPKQTTDFPIAEFGDWRDPTSPTDYVPSKDVPYIIQWHDSYFTNRYISFFGATGQTIATFSAGDAPSSDNVVNVYGNNSMQSGSVAGAYLLENDYGSNGAWLRLEDASEARTILPFECYIRANTPTTTKYRVLRRDMTIDDTPTGLDQIINRKSSNRKFIKDGQLFIIRDNKMYNVMGMEVQK